MKRKKINNNDDEKIWHRNCFGIFCESKFPSEYLLFFND